MKNWSVTMEKDNSLSMVNQAANEVKAAIRLDESGQSPKFSGHESADYGSGPDKGVAGPHGVGE
jgi:hypothetical protein